MLFLKRLSDRFDEAMEELKKKYKKQGYSDEVIEKELENIEDQLLWLGNLNACVMKRFCS